MKDNLSGVAIESNAISSVLFVCTGNICRSPMAEKMFQRYLGDKNVNVRSAGTSSWHVGEPMDRRAVQVLAARGCETNHAARRIDSRCLDSDLIVALGVEHRIKLLRKGVPSGRVRLLAEFNPELDDAFSIPDPVSGSLQDFEIVADLISGSLEALAIEAERLARSV